MRPIQAGDRAVTLLRGGTAPEDVAALSRALLARLEDKGLLAAGPHPPATAPARGDRSLLVPVAPDEEPGGVLADLGRRLGEVPLATDLILRTSGSTTGTGRLVAMSAEALVTSARATHARLDGPGRWVLALPAHHVAGLQVLVRSAVAGTAPVVVDGRRGFCPRELAGAVRAAVRAGGPPVYTSLVPTQLHAVLAPGQERWAADLARAAGILIGGAAADPDLLARARRAGLRVVTTYGMSETGGGCVYDGLPLDGVSVRIEDAGPDGVGRIILAGPVLAEGYVEASGVASFPGEELVTADRGRIGHDGRLEVLGRIDDLIVTGGVKVDPRQVEQVLLDLPGVGQACVVGLPDPRWGSAVAAAVVPQAGACLDPETIRALARERLGGVRAPKTVALLAELPVRGPGKVDRQALVERLTRAAPRSRAGGAVGSQADG
ncbi:MAG: AMP-binding protein [Actinomyces sp.]|uniref:AMP-binding protein n=1 Tax=Actinomyces sp. TaxID=29317 RepID=UPI0026DADA36|nr:AMP-binding protein [Actinomyces sp.]MDO4242159.1 AMP-binding protein [Actinomyces sp.]